MRSLYLISVLSTDYKEIIERLGATLNVDKQARVVVPVRYKTLRELIEDYLKKEYDVSDHSNCRSHFFSIVYVTKIPLPLK
jgi:hypothetical protein